MSGLDIEGVLAAHATYAQWADDAPRCQCGAALDTQEFALTEHIAAAHRAHVAAVLREQIVAWLVAEADWRWEPDSEIPDVLAELAALVACVDPSPSESGSIDPEVRQSADRTSSPSRVPGEET